MKLCSVSIEKNSRFRKWATYHSYDNNMELSALLQYENSFFLCIGIIIIT